MIWLYTENIRNECIDSDVNNTARLSAVILTHAWKVEYLLVNSCNLVIRGRPFVSIPAHPER
jgi:hypothetical protein